MLPGGTSANRLPVLVPPLGRVTRMVSLVSPAVALVPGVSMPSAKPAGCAASVIV